MVRALSHGPEWPPADTARGGGLAEGPLTSWAGAAGGSDLPLPGFCWQLALSILAPALPIPHCPAPATDAHVQPTLDSVAEEREWTHLAGQAPSQASSCHSGPSALTFGHPGTHPVVAGTHTAPCNAT